MVIYLYDMRVSFFFQAEDGIRDIGVLEFRRVLFRSRSSLMRFDVSVSKACGHLLPTPITVRFGISGSGFKTSCVVLSGLARRSCKPARCDKLNEIGRASCRERV